MKLNVGKVGFPIEFDNGDKDIIYFNPNDPELGNRLINSKKRIEERVKNLSETGKKLAEDDKYKDVKMPEKIEDMSDLTEEQQKALEYTAEAYSTITGETTKILCEEIDAAFGSEISHVVFKHCSPLAVVNGEYFIIQFLNAITPEIQKHIKKSNAAVEKRMDKHIGKYRKNGKLKMEN